MAISDAQHTGPVNVEIIRKKTGGERVLINGEDISMICTDYEILAHPGDLKRLRVTFLVGSLKMSDERMEVTTADDAKPVHI